MVSTKDHEIDDRLDGNTADALRLTAARNAVHDGAKRIGATTIHTSRMKDRRGFSALALCGQIQPTATPSSMATRICSDRSR